jgi:hypothetical protein
MSAVDNQQRLKIFKGNNRKPVIAKNSQRCPKLANWCPETAEDDLPKLKIIEYKQR